MFLYRGTQGGAESDSFAEEARTEETKPRNSNRDHVFLLRTLSGLVRIVIFKIMALI